MRLGRHFPRLYRLAVLIAIVWLVHAQHQWLRSQRDTALTLEQIAPFFPGAAELGPREPPYNLQTVSDAGGRVLGMALHTSPESDHIRGYSGPSDVLLALDPTGRVIGASLLASEDTVDHVEAVVEDEAFWRAFHGLTLGSPGRPEIDVVSESTLTSDAIVQSVVDRLGGVAESTLFPTGILLAEVQLLLPEATELGPEWSTLPGVHPVFTKAGETYWALRTSPSQDALLGYQGPSDILILLGPGMKEVAGLRLRKSYDNEDYYERILEDEDYLQLYNGMTVEEVAGIDFQEAGIEGVSGATMTSWAVAEAVKRRLQGFLSDRDAPAEAALPFRWRDYILLAIVAGAFLMAFTKLRGKAPIRIAWQVTLVVVLGFLTGDLLSQALLAGWAQNGVDLLASLGIVALAAAAFLVPWTTGKQIYCHHLCPHGALQQWMQKLPVKNLKVGKRTHRILSALPVVLLALVLASVMLGLGLNLAAVEAFDAYLFRVAGWVTITIAIGGLLASAFVPLAYCKYGCPTGLLLKFVRWRGAGERFDKRDLLAGIFLGAAVVIYAV